MIRYPNFAFPSTARVCILCTSGLNPRRPFHYCLSTVGPKVSGKLLLSAKKTSILLTSRTVSNKSERNTILEVVTNREAVSVSKVIDALSNPILTPPRGDENVQSFHVVAPSIPGFGFSDPIPEVANNLQASAEVFDALMKGLGYNQYIAHGTGWYERLIFIAKSFILLII